MRLRHSQLLAVVAAFAQAAASECRDDLNEADGYTIRSVRIEGRWVPALALPIKAGDRFSNAGVQAAMEAVQEALNTEDRKQFEMQNLGAIGVLHITRCLLVDGHDVDVVIQTHSVRVDLFNVGGNILPIPRSALATFYDAVPAPIRALNPTFGAYQDKEYGFAPMASVDANGNILPNARLEVAASGRKSVEHSFYNADVDVALSTQHPGATLEKLSLDLDYHGANEPRNNDTFMRQAGELGVSLRLRPNLGLIRTVSLGANYRFAENRFTNNSGRMDTDESAVQFHVLIDGRTGGAFLRAAMWADAGWPDRGSNYGRIAALAAFAKEILVARNQTIGVEAIIGGGHAWSAPGYAQFYGGNTNRNFLYESLDSPLLSRFPSGPIMRSFGEGQSPANSINGNHGATSYWHMNVNVSFPIPALSAPLIPDEEVLPGLSLKQLLKNKAGDAVSYYAVQLESEGVPPAEALARAKAMYGEVRPAIEFIADRANVYALKPLLLFDLGGQDEPGRGHRVSSALGAGLELTIVTAKMQIGYMHTVWADDNVDSGNFFARIVFENIF